VHAAGGHRIDRLRRPDGGLWRVFHSGRAKIDGMLEDFGGVALGLVTLAQALPPTRAAAAGRYLEAAEQLADLAVKTFWDEQRRAYHLAPRSLGDLLVPTFALHDNAVPSGASLLTEALVTLGALTGRARHLEQARAWVEQVHDELTTQPMALGHLWLAADALLDGAPEVTVVGTATALGPFRDFFADTYLPTVATLLHLSGAPPHPVVKELLDQRPARGDVSAFLCRAFACQPPVSTVAALSEALQGTSAKQ
jgi:uncharacterized protein YyaL (SSP411 family)